MEQVIKNMTGIKPFSNAYDLFDMTRYTNGASKLMEYYADLGPHFTYNLFPYGFTFESISFGQMAAPYEGLKHDWESVIKTLTGSDENGGLKKLKTILDGEKCTPAPPPKPRPRPAPAPRPPRPARPAPPPKPTTGNSSGAQGFRGAGGNRNSGNGGQMESGARRVKGSGGAGYRRGSGAQRSATQVKSVAQSRTASRLSHVQASSAQKAAQPQNADNSSSQQVAGPQQLVEIKAPPAPSVSVSRNHATSSTTTVQEPDIPSVSPQEKPGHIASSHTPATPGRSGTSGDSNDQARSSNPFVQPGVSVSSSVSNPPNGQTLPTDRVVSSAAAIHPTTHRAASDGGDGIGGNGTAGEMGSTGGSDSTGSSTSLPHPPPPAQLEPLPASHDVTAVPELPKEVVPEKKVTVIKAPEPITPKIAEGTNKLEGTPIHGGTLGVNPMQDNNQNTEKSPSPVVVTSVQVVSPGSDHQNPQGSEADQSPHAVGGNDSVASSDSSVQDPVLTQQHVTQSTYMSQSPSSPSSAATPEVTGTQGDLGADISAVVQPALQTVAPPDAVDTPTLTVEPQVQPAHSPTASSRSSAAPAPPVPLGDPGGSSQGDASSGRQPAVSTDTLVTQSPSVTESVFQPSSVLAPSGSSSPDSNQGSSQHGQQNGLSSTTTSDTGTTMKLPGQGVDPGSGEAAGGTDGHSQDNLDSQPHAQSPNPSDLVAARTSSLGGGSPLSPALTLQSSPQGNSNDQSAGTSDESTTTVSQYDASASAGGADAAGKQAQQSVDNNDNASQGQPGPTLSVPTPPPPSAPEPTTADTPSDSDTGSKNNSTLTQEPALPQGSGVQPPGSSSSEISDSDSDPVAPGSNGDQGSPGAGTLQPSPQPGHSDPQGVKQEPTQATSSPDSATSPTTIPAPSSQPGKADGGDQGLKSNSNPAQPDVTSQAAALSQLASVSDSVSSPYGTLSSATVQQPNAQLAAQDNQQSAHGSHQSLSATKMSAPPVQSSDSDVNDVSGVVGASSIVQPPDPNIEISFEVGKFDDTLSDANSNALQDQATNKAPNVIFDIIKPTFANYGEDSPATPSLTPPVGLHRDYDAINDVSDETKETRSNTEDSVDLFIDVLKHPPSQPLAEYDPEYIHAAPKLGRPKVDDLDDLALKDAEGAKMYTPLAVFPGQSPFDDNPNVCQAPWYVPEHSKNLIPPIVTPPPVTDHLHSPKTVREMLYWLVGVVELGYIGFIRKHVDVVLDDVNTDSFLPTNVLLVTRNLTTVTSHEISQTLTAACHYAAKVLHRLKHRDVSNETSIPEFNAEYRNYYYSSDPDGLLCQLRDYVYAAHHQLMFLRSQCGRDKFRGGWKSYEYSSGIKEQSPLQAFLTDSWDST
ncbi:hypothetical protein, conserved, partial [Babesia bigemina]